MTHDTSRRARALAATTAIVVAAALGVGACSSDSGSESNAKSNSKSSTGAAAEAPKVAIEDFAFSPDTLRVKVGTKVTFTNGDGFDHTVTAKDKSFDSGHLAKDAVFEHTFDAPGTYPYLCSIHNSMTGSVVVS